MEAERPKALLPECESHVLMLHKEDPIYSYIDCASLNRSLFESAVNCQYLLQDKTNRSFASLISKSIDEDMKYNNELLKWLSHKDPTVWGESINAGVGLTLLKEFCSLAGGCFFMASGNGVCLQLAGDNSLRQTSLQGSFCGTVCALSFTRAKIRNFPELLHKAKQSVSLLPAGEEFGKYFT